MGTWGSVNKLLVPRNSASIDDASPLVLRGTCVAVLCSMPPVPVTFISLVTNLLFASGASVSLASTQWVAPLRARGAVVAWTTVRIAKATICPGYLAQPVAGNPAEFNFLSQSLFGHVPTSISAKNNNHS